MKVLTLFRSQPEEKYKDLAAQVAQGHEVKEVHLYAQDPVDYDQLLQDILDHDVTHSWW